MKNISIIMSLALLMLPGCSQEKKQEAQRAVTTVAPATSSMLVINLLDKAHYDDAHIKGSVHVPLDQLTDYAAALDKSKPVVVYCSNYQCGSSGVAYQLLTSLGFTDVWAYEGGMAEWYKLGLPTEGPAQRPYLHREIKKVSTEQEQIRIITAQELYEKMQKHHLL